MISMMLFYSCTCTTNRTGKTKYSWTHIIHICRHKWDIPRLSVLQALRKNAADTVLLIMLKTLNKRAWDTETCLLSVLTDCHIRWVFVRTNETVCYTVDLYGCPFEVGVRRAEFHCEFHCTDEPHYAVIEGPWEYTSGEMLPFDLLNSLEIQCISSPKSGLGADFICTKNKLLKLEAHYHH